VEKSVPSQPFLSFRRVYGAFDHVVQAVGETFAAGRAALPAGARDKIVVLAHSEFDEEALDIEMGWTLHRMTNRRISVRGERLALGELPPLASCAAVVRSDPDYQSHLAFGAVGRWMEANRRTIAGPGREVFLEFPDRPGKHPVIEIQFPLAPAA
jgi:hypothetical protein